MIDILLAALVAAASSDASPRVDAVEIVVRDLARERRFFVEALHFRDAGKRTVPDGTAERLTLGEQHIDLIHYARPGAPIPAGARSSDRTFQHIAVIVSDMDRAWASVERFAIRKVSPAPQLLPKSNPNAGGIAAVYFRDPEGHPLELLHFPADKGAPQWHASSPLFLGVDHTAIAVTDTAASTRFYQGLGLRVRGHSNNFGIEQQRLSGVSGAHVAITAVRFDAAPGVEFLQYLSPHSAQPPENAAVADALATRTRIVTPKSRELCASHRQVAPVPDGCIVRDPDGHLVELDAE